MASVLDQNYWDELYQVENTPWDIGFASPPIIEYLQEVDDKDVKILIPGAGRAYEAIYLIENGFTDVTICDISPSAIAHFKTNYPGWKKINIVEGDFFGLAGGYDLIIEQTFFCALNPSMRLDYVLKMSTLLRPGGVLAGLLFCVYFDFQGPPFGGNKEAYTFLFEPYFVIETMEVASNSITQRAGNELFIILKKR